MGFTKTCIPSFFTSPEYRFNTKDLFFHPVCLLHEKIFRCANRSVPLEVVGAVLGSVAFTPPERNADEKQYISCKTRKKNSSSTINYNIEKKKRYFIV